MNIYLEIFGYIGTALVILSMMMTSLLKLRVINICGSTISAVYSILCNAWPIVVMNVCLILINSFQIIQKVRHKKPYGHLQLSCDDPTARYFFSLYRDHIQKIFPDYRLEAHDGRELHMIYVGNEAVGVFVGSRREDSYHLEMGYVLPKYCDDAMGKYLFGVFEDRGIGALTAPAGNVERARAFKHLGFEESGDVLLKKK